MDSHELSQALTCLDFPSIRTLSIYLKYRMDAALSTTEDDGGGDTLGRCIHWLTCILDAHYTHFVLGGESSLVEDLLGVVERGTAWMEAIAELEPYLILTQQRVDFSPRPSPHSKWRTEVLTFV